MERLHERVFKTVDLGEILAPVVLGFAENFVFNQIENDFAKIRAPTHSPRLEDGFGQRSKLFERVCAQSLQQLAARHML